MGGFVGATTVLWMAGIGAIASAAVLSALYPAVLDATCAVLDAACAVLDAACAPYLMQPAPYLMQPTPVIPKGYHRARILNARADLPLPRTVALKIPRAWIVRSCRCCCDRASYHQVNRQQNFSAMRMEHLLHCMRDGRSASIHGAGHRYEHRNGIPPVESRGRIRKGASSWSPVVNLVTCERKH
jgi:hypothetical protein